jgi:serine/threonine-protein kinase
LNERSTESVPLANDDFAVLADLLRDRWELLRVVGRGGMATVYLARDRRHGREVAIKVLRRELSAVLGAERFLQEIEIAARLSHPHILPLFDSAEVGGYLLYIMPFVAGESLRDRLDRIGPLPIPEAVEITRQVASALDHAHQQGVVHRDIKPENILLQAGQAVVADFGIARAIDVAGGSGAAGRLTEAGVAVGTPHYMSPEQISGEPATGRSDIYSLGCVFYEMVAGKPPFEGSTAAVVFGGHVTGKVPPLKLRRPEVDRTLERVVATALAKSPADRFTTAASLADALGGTGRRSVRTRPTTLIAAAVVIAAVVGLGWMALSLRDPDRSARRASLAVLYLDNLSRDSADQYLADGITEEMIARLGNVDRLTVPARGRVRRYRGRPIDDPASVGADLGVGFLVSGSLERGGSKLRVRIELVEAKTGSQLWGATFDQVGTDVLAIEDSIARAVAGEVIGRLAPTEVASLTAKPTTNLEAYDHFLRGNFYLARRTGEADGRRALQEYQRALAVEPDFPAALGRLGLVYGIYANWPWPFPGLGTDSLVARGLVAANRAIALDSNSADGWLARGFLLTPGPADADGWDGFRVAPNLLWAGIRCWAPESDCMTGARAALQRAVRLAPRDAEIWYQLGRAQPGAAGDSAIQRSLALEPDRAVAVWLLGQRHLAARRWAPAERMMDSAIALGRRDLSAYGLRLEARLGRGDVAGALADLAEVDRLTGTDSVAAVYGAAMRIAVDVLRNALQVARARADSLLRRFPPARVQRPSMLIGMAAALVTVGETDQGLDLLDRAVKPTGFQWPGQLGNALWDPITGDPRFRAIKGRILDAATRQESDGRK